MGWIISVAIIGGLVVLYILFAIINSAKEKYSESKRRKTIRTNFQNKEYQKSLERLNEADIPQVLTVDDVLLSLENGDFTAFEVFEYLVKFSLLKLPRKEVGIGYHPSYDIKESKINEKVPEFIFKLAKKRVYDGEIIQIRQLYEILNVVKQYFNANIKSEYAPIDASFVLVSTYIDKSGISISNDETLSLISKAKSIFGMGDEYGTERERAALRYKQDELRTKMERSDRFAQVRTENLEAKKIALDNERKEYEKKLNEVIEREKRDELVLKKAHEKVEKYEKEISELIEVLKTESNVKLFPYLAHVVSDLKTIELQKTAEALDWGIDENRLKKAKSLLEIRKEVKEQLEDAQVSYYQLKYLLELFPSLQDILDAEYGDIAFDLKDFDYNDNDPVRRFLSKEEWEKLSESERNQLALDRYVSSHSKNNWQIGRDYELYIGQKYMADGYDVDFTGSYMGLEDMGRDLICKKRSEILIVQCKYWSKEKTIHENHINQLFGTMTSYCIENKIKPERVKGVFITNTTLSETATKFADLLKIVVIQDKKMEEFPRIKCNLGVDEFGQQTKIYHLPMDLSYDVAKIVKPGEFFAKTVKEAERAGFRRSYKWHGIGEDS